MSCISQLRAALMAPFAQIRRWSLVAAAVVLGLALPAAPIFAQSAATGTVRGKVQNASNGAYLKNAIVKVTGSAKEAITDAFGAYELDKVPAGAASLTASYVGEPDQTVTVQVASGAAATQDFTFRKSSVTRLDNDGTVILDPLVVTTERYKNAAAIAVAEERNSVNIKNVVSTEAFGDIPGGNVGEFVKFMPGVQIDYGAFQGAQTGYSENAPSGISIRGFGPEDTAILIDGMPVSNASPGSLTRQVGLDMLSINNASRVELIKVATPDMPNNSVGGQVNLITKSAFEFAKPSYSARIFFNTNSLNTKLSKTPGPTNKATFKTTPGAEFSVLYPINKNLGITFTGYGARQFDQTYRGETTQAFPTGSTPSTITNASGPQSISNPAMTRFRMTDIARLVDTTSGNLKLDWRPSPAQTLSANLQYSSYTSSEAQRRLDFRPTNAAGADWGPSFYTGTTANSTTDMTVTTVDKVGKTTSGQLQYNFQQSGWKIFAGASLSVSNGDNRDHENGHYSEIALKLNPGQVKLNNIVNGIPGSVTTYDRIANGGAVRDYTLLNNYSLDGTIAKSGQAHSKNTVGVYKLDVERALDFLPFLRSNTVLFKVGARHDSEKTEKSGVGTGYRDVIDPTKSSFYAVANILDTDYAGVSPGFGYPAQQWGSSYKLYALNQANQIFITPTDGADAVANWDSYVGQQKSMTETTTGAYAMLTGQFFNNRLSFVSGVRQEQKTREGRGPYIDNKWNYAKLANGNIYRDSVTGGPILFTNASFLSDSALLARMRAAGVTVPDHAYGPTATSIESRKLNRIANRYVSQKITNQPSPSLSTSFALTKKIDLKAAWSRSFKLPALEDTTQGLVSGNNSFTTTENDIIPADGTQGEIKVANPGLLPEISSNWDFQAAYYTDKGGKFSVSFFTKSVTNQAQNISIYANTDPALFNEVLTALELDPAAYQNWKLTTATNSDTVQKTHGFEYEVRQDFSFLGGWGNHFQVFASYTQNSLGSPASVTPVTITSPAGTPTTITPTVKTIALRSNRFASAGLQFATQRFSAQLRGTYKNANEQTGNRVTLPNGNFLRRMEPGATRIDVNLSYQFTKNYSVFLSGRDVFNAERKVIIRDDLGLLPAYAQQFDTKKFGVTWTVGVNGKW